MPDDNSLGIETCSNVENSLLNWVVFDVILSVFHVNIGTQRKNAIHLMNKMNIGTQRENSINLMNKMNNGTH